MIDRLVIFGGTGDLSGRFLLPALATLHGDGRLGDQFQVTATGRRDWSDEDYREWATGWLNESDVDVSPEWLESMHYRTVDLGSTESVAAAIAGTGPAAIYLALPPTVSATAIAQLRETGVPQDSMIIVEKPFGDDLQTARDLNRQLAEFVDERHVYRVDHFLAMTTVQNVLGMRLTNRLLEPVWNSTHIERIDIIWDESLALEGRAGYYDHVGALKDMIQNHLLQLMCLVAMEPPISLDERDLRDRKVEVLRTITTFTADDVIHRTRRARYSAGRIGTTDIPSYTAEDGVDAGRLTETFAEITLTIDNWRWSGTVFRLRSGKGLGDDKKELVVHFRPVPGSLYGPADQLTPNVLRFELEPDGVTLELNAIDAESPTALTLRQLTAATVPGQSAYSTVLLDALTGNTTLSIRADEAEEAWQLLTPVLETWAAGEPAMEDYPAGSDGPAARG